MNEIARKVLNTVRKEMAIDNAGVILFESGREDCRSLFITESKDAAEKDKLEEECYSQDDPFVRLMKKEKKMLTVYDVLEDPYYAGERGECSQRFQDLGASVALPLMYQNGMTGILAVGNKKSGKFLGREEVQLIEMLASSTAVAVENTKLTEQMKREEKVRANLARYLSPQVVEKIMRHEVQVDLGGDRKVVSVLFSDIRNFTSIVESRPPDEIVAILNEYFTEMARVIFENQGSLDKYIGDAIVAVYGSVIPLENASENAVRTAAQMMQAMERLNERWKREYDGFSMGIGIGVNTGEVFLGNVGSPERMEFTVIGDAVNVAARFSGLAKAGQIFVTEEVDRRLGPDVKCVERESVAVKGKSEMLKLFEIVREGQK
jgi:adenylate cyclase